MTKLSQLLKSKSEELNLFSKGDREKIESKHMPDALAVLEFWDPRGHILDMGTGGGLPGLALAEACPDAGFSLLDSRQKKIDAVEAMADEVGLENVHTLCGRIEEVAHDPDYRESFDFVTARALAPLPVLLEYAAGFLIEGGQLLAWKSADYEEELTASETAQSLLNLHFESAHGYTLPTGEERVILTFMKTGDLSGKYPRAVGVPKKRPL